jgi:hypothetical protein
MLEHYTKSFFFFFLLFLPGFVLFLSISVSLLEKLEDETKLQATRKSEMSKPVQLKSNPVKNPISQHQVQHLVH